MEMRTDSAPSRRNQHPLTIAALLAALLFGLLAVSTARAATDAHAAPADRSGLAAVVDLATPSPGGCGVFAAVSAPFGVESFVASGPSITQFDEHVYPDADGNCPSGYTKYSVYECTYDKHGVATCGYIYRCYED